eukprot:7206946-Prymnesium_polylepis.2
MVVSEVGKVGVQAEVGSAGRLEGGTWPSSEGYRPRGRRLNLGLALEATTPFTNHHRRAGHLWDSAPQAVPNSRHIVREVWVRHVTLAAMAVRVGQENKPVGNGEIQRRFCVADDIFTPPASVPTYLHTLAAATTNTLHTNQPARALGQNRIAYALGSITPILPLDIIRLVEHIGHDDVAIRRAKYLGQCHPSLPKRVFILSIALGLTAPGARIALA